MNPLTHHHSPSLACIDLSDYVKSTHLDVPPLYDLYAVSQHSGGLGGGHYTAVCQNHIDKFWYNFNDRFVGHRLIY